MKFTNAQDVLNDLDLTPLDAADPIRLIVGPVRVGVLCGDALRAHLVAYFADALDHGPEQAPDLTVHVLEGQTIAPDVPWRDWVREAGKSGRKDAYLDLADARLIHKVRTGMTFLQSRDAIVAAGPAAAHDSQIINFINTQVLNLCLRDDWQLCHAAAVTGGGRGLAIAGLSGGGKSTSILRMMDLEDTRFVSNDRLLVKPGTPARALGIPKHPRINPGTILGNARLHPLLSSARLGELAAMPAAELWPLEEKHDLIIPAIYGPGRVQYEAPLSDLWVLNWSRDAGAATQMTEVDLATRPDLLGAVMKSPGPFYQQADGAFIAGGTPLIPRPYLEALAGVRVTEVTGRIDFDVLADAGRDLFGG